MNTVPRVFVYLRRYPWMAVGTLACAILSTLMLIVFPAVTKRVIDDVLGKNQPELLTPLILAAALAFVLQNGLNFAPDHSQQRVRAAIPRFPSLGLHDFTEKNYYAGPKSI